MFGFLNMMDNYEQRKVANTDVDGGTVDTSAVTDSAKPFETGIQHPAYNNGEWVIVELYESREAAKVGHSKWVKLMSKQPNYLDDVNECDIASLAEVLGGTIRARYPRKET